FGVGAAAPGDGPHGCGGAHPRRAALGREARHAAHDGPGAPREGDPPAARARPRARARRLPRLVRGGDHLRRPRADGVRAGAPADAGGVRAADQLIRLAAVSRNGTATTWWVDHVSRPALTSMRVGTAAVLEKRRAFHAPPCERPRVLTDGIMRRSRL